MNSITDSINSFFKHTFPGIRLYFILLMAITTVIGCCTLPKSSFPIGERDFIDNEENLDRLYKSTVMIVDMDLSTGELVPVCSGVFISKNYILTARHCVYDQENFSEKGKENEFLPNDKVKKAVYKKVFPFISRETYERKNSDLTSIKITDCGFAEIQFVDIYSNKDDSKDMAVLKISSKHFENEHWLRVAKNNIAKGKKIYLVGSPMTIPWIVTSGRVSQYLLLNDLTYYKNSDFNKFFNYYQTKNKVYAFDLSAWNGMSGGPIVNNHGEIVSILTITVTSNVTNAGGLAVGILTTEINTQLKQNKIILDQ